MPPLSQTGVTNLLPQRVVIVRSNDQGCNGNRGHSRGFVVTGGEGDNGPKW
jgi:hypothetical protein